MSCYVAHCYTVALLNVIFDLSHSLVYVSQPTYSQFTHLQSVIFQSCNFQSCKFSCTFSEEPYHMIMDDAYIRPTYESILRIPTGSVEMGKSVGMDWCEWEDIKTLRLSICRLQQELAFPKAILDCEQRYCAMHIPAR